MGKKKSSLFSSVKNCFTPKKEKKPDKKGKKGKGNWEHVETKSFVPFFRAPSSIEKILGEADQLNIHPRVSLESVKIIEKSTSPKVVCPKAASPRARFRTDLYPENTLYNAFSGGSSNGTESKLETSNTKRPVSTLPPETCNRSDLYPIHKTFSAVSDPLSNATARKVETKAASSTGDDNTSALKIQAAYRGYLARRSFRALKGLMRLQGVMRGPNVRRQTMNAMKHMQLLVRVQTQIRSQWIPEHPLRRQAYLTNKEPEAEAESSLSKQSLNRFSLGSRRNGDWDHSSLAKEESEARLQKKVEAVVKRERAMAYSYSHQQRKLNARSPQTPPDLRFDAYPWRWNWFDSHQATSETSRNEKIVASTPRGASSEYKMSPRLHPRCYKHRGGYDSPLKDDESLMSCSTTSMYQPHYMTPTVSAMVKFQETSNRNERFPGTPNSDRRFSFPLTPNNGTFKSGTPRSDRRLSSPRSIRSSGWSSNVSPSLAQRKPFNRF